MSEIARYEQEINEEFFAELVQLYDGNVVIKNASETFLLLISSEKDIYRYYFDSYRGHRYELHNVRVFKGFENMVWEERIVIEYPVLKLSGKRIHTSSEKMEHYHGFRGIIFALKTDKGFKAVSVVKDIFRIFPLLESTEKLNNIILKNSSAEKVLANCLDSERYICGFDLLGFSSVGAGYYTELYPYKSGGDADGVIIMLSKDTDPSGFDNSMMTAEKEFVEDNKMIAMCRIRTSKAGETLFSDMNTLMARYISENRITKSFIIGTRVFGACFRRGISRLGMVKYEGGDGECCYIMGAYPSGGTEDIKYITVFVIAGGPQELLGSRISEEQLTPRETNILRLSAEGSSVRDISDMLSISESTAKSILCGSYKKIDAKSKTEAILKLYGLTL